MFIIAKTWKQPKCPSINDWFKKVCGGVCVCVCVLVIKINLPFAATWIDLENIRLSEVSQTKENTT